MFFTRFVLPAWLRPHLRASNPDPALLEQLRRDLARFQEPDPEVSIVVPAYNEEKNILRTLSSLSALRSQYRMELIVANNNSRDRTQELLDACGVRSIFVTDQGVAHARQAGLMAAKGRFVVNADSDSLYPPYWVDALVKPLETKAISCTYGSYSFVPSSGSRFWLTIYEFFTDIAARMRHKNREIINVLGFNFAFRRADALAVGGFNVETGHKGDTLTGTNRTSGACEDGWMALTLMDYGRLRRVAKARAWTSDRRLIADGGLGLAFRRRLQRELKRLVSPPPPSLPKEPVNP